MNILVVDDHVILRKGLLVIIEKELDDCKCFEALNGIEALSILRKEKIDIVLSDISMPELNGIDMLKQMKALKINVPVLILSMQPEDQYALRAIKAGAYGFIDKNCSPDTLISAIKTVRSGNKFITPSVSDLLVNAVGGKSVVNQHDLLSDRELQVLSQMSIGKSLLEIANETGLSINTVSTYRARILAKLGLKNNSELIRYAIEHKLDQM